MLLPLEYWGRFLDRYSRAIRCSPKFFAAFCSAKVGHWRTATFDRAISMNVAERKTYEKSTPGRETTFKSPPKKYFPSKSVEKKMEHVGKMEGVETGSMYVQ